METTVKNATLKNIYKDKKGQQWSYLTEEEALKSKTGSFNILGDFSCEKPADAQLVGTLNGLEDQVAYIKAFAGNSPKGYYVKGYIPLENEEQFVRILAPKRGRYLVGLIAIFMLLTMFLGGLWLGNSNQGVDHPVKIKKGELTNPNPANIRILGMSKLTAKPNSTRVKKQLINVEGNAYNLTYTITLKETGEVLYTSPAIKPGYGVQEFDMSRSFKKGNYPVTVTINTSAKDDQQKKGKTKSNVAYNAGKLDATLVVE